MIPSAKDCSTSRVKGGTSRTVRRSPLMRKIGGKPALRCTSEAPSCRAAWRTRSRIEFMRPCFHYISGAGWHQSMAGVVPGGQKNGAGDSRAVPNRSKFFRVSDVPATAAGQEILVVDGDEQVVKGLDRLLTRVGLTVTGTGDHGRARDQILNKYFAVALIDFDTPTPGGGLELLQFARDKSPLMSVIMMSNRKSFDTAVKSFRGGAIDVVLKEPEV